jgi:hypothetical protein
MGNCLKTYALCLVFGLGSVVPALSSDAPVQVNTVALGTDYLTTGAGTQFDFGSPFGVVNFKGLPVGPGSTDTIVQRTQDAEINGSPITTQLIQLSLQSVAPVNLGGNFYDVFVKLDPTKLALDTGSMTIDGGIGGGTFSSTLDVFFDAQFVPLGSGVTPFDIFSSIVLSGSGSWGPLPGPGQLIVPGVDDNGSTDQPANQHSGLDPCGVGTVAPAPCEVDFFVKESFRQTGPGGLNVVGEATPTTPEPATFTLAGCVLLAAFTTLGRRRR